jgi:hypothetical protein
MSQPDNYVTCHCQNCGKGIEFNAADLSDGNTIVRCPHCGLETRLSVPLADYPPVLQQSKEPPILKVPPQLPGTMKLHWRGNEMELVGDQVIIRKYNLAATFKYGMIGDRAISIASITAIQVRHADILNPGRIILSYPGSKPFTGGFLETRDDPDIFLFGMELNQQVEDFKNAVESIMRSMRRPAPLPVSTTLPDEIRKLAELKEQGLLSEEEFEAAKKKLLT